jgi:hypothetical protein
MDYDDLRNSSTVEHSPPPWRRAAVGRGSCATDRILTDPILNEPSVELLDGLLEWDGLFQQSLSNAQLLQAEFEADSAPTFASDSTSSSAALEHPPWRSTEVADVVVAGAQTSVAVVADSKGCKGGKRKGSKGVMDQCGGSPKGEYARRQSFNGRPATSSVECRARRTMSEKKIAARALYLANLERSDQERE